MPIYFELRHVWVQRDPSYDEKMIKVNEVLFYRMRFENRIFSGSSLGV